MKTTKKSTINIFDKIDQSDCQIFKFGDIVSNISERVEPSETEALIYVGLEHLDAGSIHIRRTGVPADVKGVKLKVYKGDIIFGKRRAYQRKAAIAHFDGICSAHSMVLRANSNIIDPELLPFFIHSDAFMNKAIDISEGSLSPTIKWKILKEQKFSIPSIVLQKKLVKLLLAFDKLENNQFNLILDKKILKKSLIKKILENKVSEELTQNKKGNKIKDNFYTGIAILNDKWPMVRLNEVVKAKSGNGKIKGRLLKKNNGSLFPGFSATGQDVFVENYDYDSEGIVISAVGARCGKCFLANGKWSAIANTHVLLPKNKKVMAKYVWLIVNDENVWIRGGVAQPFVKVNDSLNKKIPLPPIKVQKEILSIFSKIEIDLDITIDVYKSTEEFKFAIINHFFK